MSAVAEQVREDLEQEAIGQDAFIRAVVQDLEVRVAGDPVADRAVELRYPERVIEGAEAVHPCDALEDPSTLPDRLADLFGLLALLSFEPGRERLGADVKRGTSGFAALS